MTHGRWHYRKQAEGPGVACGLEHPHGLSHNVYDCIHDFVARIHLWDLVDLWDLWDLPGEGVSLDE
jgi:hypothetical protein